MSELVEIDDVELMPRKRRRENGSLDITPMIDITFLLLIFFIVTSTMRSDALRTMPEAKNGSQVSARDSAVITVTAGGTGGRVHVFLGDGTEPSWLAADGDLAVQEQEVSDYVAQAFAGTSDESSVPKRHLLIKAEGKVPYGEVERISMAASRGGNVDSISQVYIGVQEKK